MLLLIHNSCCCQIHHCCCNKLHHWWSLLHHWNFCQLTIDTAANSLLMLLLNSQVLLLSNRSCCQFTTDVAAKCTSDAALIPLFTNFIFDGTNSTLMLLSMYAQPLMLMPISLFRLLQIHYQSCCCQINNWRQFINDTAPIHHLCCCQIYSCCCHCC